MLSGLCVSLAVVEALSPYKPNNLSKFLMQIHTSVFDCHFIFEKKTRTLGLNPLPKYSLYACDFLKHCVSLCFRLLCVSETNQHISCATSQPICYSCTLETSNYKKGTL